MVGLMADAGWLIWKAGATWCPEKADQMVFWKAGLRVLWMAGQREKNLGLWKVGQKGAP